MMSSSSVEHADSAVDALSADVDRVIHLRSEARKANGHVLDPEKDGLVRLELEHDEITRAMNHTLNAAIAYQNRPDKTQPQADEVNRLMDQTIQLIVQHASLEEQFVYPLFGSKLKGAVAGVTAEMIYERNVVDDDVNKRILDLLLKMKIEQDSELMISTIKKFQIVEEEHLCQEEHWFALLRSQLSAGELSTLATKMASAGTPTRPHSLVGPSHGLAARLTHPIAGVVDRVIDKAIGRQPIGEGEHSVKKAELEQKDPHARNAPEQKQETM